MGPFYRAAKRGARILRGRLWALRCATVHGGGNEWISIRDANPEGATFVLLKGVGNRIVVDGSCSLKDCRITVLGNTNTILIGAGTALCGGELYVRGDGIRIDIGEHCTLLGCGMTGTGTGSVLTVGSGTNTEAPVDLVVHESTKLTVGEDCMFGSDVRVCTSDSHSMIDADGRRLNPARDVYVGDHVWLSYRATVLKGAIIAPHTVVASGAIVTKQFSEPNTTLAGVPARVIDHGIDWTRDLVP